ncbi:uncharacterized protein BDR25DRAFT_316563 [Lindgomyces ingoldianus]|uniref:Uncharacterized protein n=1 Tax=Lindgomyces ingoldianus TaxID=673940 RepID=A0ACB6QM19_9PLEO|nr:uncharacterized protein BDR25DRAFT_316563 [Lindgomyces ingoldianus]KAF2467956.1 hypothetical protein BDR25DRAFT_316563 [Lindgomyces ingoldianus]
MPLVSFIKSIPNAVSSLSPDLHFLANFPLPAIANKCISSAFPVHELAMTGLVVLGLLVVVCAKELVVLVVFVVESVKIPRALMAEYKNELAMPVEAPYLELCLDKLHTPTTPVSPLDICVEY